jgi:hypothetical protein
MAEDKTCGKQSVRYPELNLKCCIAYTPKRMRGSFVPGFKVTGAESPHKHMDLIVLNDGTLLNYRWAYRGNGESWAWMPQGRGAMKACSQEDWEKALREIGRRAKKEE